MVPLWASRRELLCVKAPPRLVESISNCLYLEIIQLLVRFLSWLIKISGSLLALWTTGDHGAGATPLQVQPQRIQISAVSANKEASFLQPWFLSPGLVKI